MRQDWSSPNDRQEGINVTPISILFFPGTPTFFCDVILTNEKSIKEGTIYALFY